MQVRHKQSIDRLTAAQSVLELLGRLDVRKFPPEERMDVAIVEIKALDEWLAAYLDIAAPRGLRVPSTLEPCISSSSRSSTATGFVIGEKQHAVGVAASRLERPAEWCRNPRTLASGET